ncbi:MAG: mucoidy inhibitor MuiA family protein [Deltaproteobacteria bacterium]|nr:mucoidy inhibitor MuiA family protein [Deltaproteobacteria bacterium]
MKMAMALVLCAAGAVRAESKIARVVVYPDRATVTRTQTVSCAAKAVEFGHLPPSIEPRSLRAASSNGPVPVVELQTRVRDTAFTAQAAEVEKQLRKLELQQRELDDRTARAQAQLQKSDALDSITTQQLSRELAAPGIDPKAWSLALANTAATRDAAAKILVDLRATQRELTRKRDELEQKQSRLGDAASKTETYARVELSCEGQATVELSYLVGNAGWTPSYEARANESANAVELTLIGQVTQRTGEDWNGAQLALSTAVPRQDATPPELVTLRVYSDERKAPQIVLVRRDVAQEHAQSGAANGPAGAPQMAATDMGLSVQLTAQEPLDIPGDGTPTSVEVGTVKLAGTFAWKVMPSQLPYVLRVADLVNAAPFPLLAGPVNLFRKGSFAGATLMERVPQGGRFQMGFGLEENVKVKRLVLDELKADTGFISKGKRYEFGYAFVLTNSSARELSVDLSEHIPVSELDDVKVELGEKTTPGFSLAKDDGIVTWPVKLAPGAEQRVELRFTVEVPSSYNTDRL